ncbi:MAG: RluA family pseudouridine synthase [Myxococcales bacterium]|nr:RluA family pseudouridine synthase [Myxococcales bacterium]
MKRRTFSVSSAEEGRPLSSVLARALGVPEADARRLVSHGAAYVGGRRCLDPQRPTHAGAVVTAVLEESGRSALEPAAPPPKLRVLFEDSELFAVDKPAGLASQATAGRTGDSLLDAVARRVGVEAGLVHRLDRDTSGVTVFGKTKRATLALSEEFRRRTARKRYLAVTGPGLPERCTVELPIAKDPSRPGRYRAVKEGRSAVTELERLYASEEFCLAALWPRTGRTHQLRVHLRALGAPILGDSLYGGAPEAAGLPARRCLLHAQALALKHPRTGEELALEAPVPEEMLAFFRRAKVEPPSGRL